jgi:RimJ/RimL family protein N-acetyltransferase
MTVRDAMPADAPALYAMADQFLATPPYVRQADPAQLRTCLEMLLTAPTGRLFVLERDGVAAGMLGMMVFVHPITGEWTASELFWWVNPEARGRGGLQLLHAAEEWATAQGASRLLMIAPDDRVGQLYARLGYRRLEATYERVLPC